VQGALTPGSVAFKIITASRLIRIFPAGPAPTSANAFGQGMKSPPEALKVGVGANTSHPKTKRSRVPAKANDIKYGTHDFPFCVDTHPDEDNVKACCSSEPAGYPLGNQGLDIGVQKGNFLLQKEMFLIITSIILDAMA